MIEFKTKDTIFADTLNFKENLYSLHQTIELSSGDNSQIITNAITITLALIASIIALYQVKSNIISSSRIKWIENLREAISNYTVEVSTCAIILNNIMDESLEAKTENVKSVVLKHYDDLRKSQITVDVLGNKILLYLNSNKKDHQKVEDSIEKISKILDHDNLREVDLKKIKAENEKIIISTKKIFKSEWEKSKKIFKI